MLHNHTQDGSTVRFQWMDLSVSNISLTFGE